MLLLLVMVVMGMVLEQMAVFEVLLLVRDLSCLMQCPFGQSGTNQLIDHNTEQNDIPDPFSLPSKLGSGGNDGGHAERNSRLREERNAEIFDHVAVTFGPACAQIRAKILSDASCKDIDNTDQHDRQVREYRELQLRTADDEEQDEQRRGPFIGFFHQIRGILAEVAEDRTKHHADEQGGKPNVHNANGKFDLGQRDRQKDRGDRNRLTLGVRLEILLRLGKKISQKGAEQQGKQNFEQRLYQYANKICRAVTHRLCNPERNCKDDKPHRVVEGYDGKQERGQLSLCLILLNHHQGCGRCRCGRNCAEKDRGRQGQLVLTERKMKTDQRAVHHERCQKGLEHADDGCLLTRCLELGKTKLISDGKGDKAKRYVRENAEARDVCKRRKSKSSNTE